MRPLADGIPSAECVFGRPPDDEKPFVVYGQTWTALGNAPTAMASGRPFFQLDNGYLYPGRGFVTGYYRICYRGISAIDFKCAPPSRIKIIMRPWQNPKHGKHVLIAMPGQGFGSAVGLDMPSWINTIVDEVRKHTDREIVVRPKVEYWLPQKPLQDDLDDCWAVVTHSSNVAVDAALAGIPVFVAPTSPAAPVGKLDLDIENPIRPDREHWFDSLMAQQYSLNEMRGGFMREMLREITYQVDGAVLEELV